LTRIVLLDAEIAAKEPAPPTVKLLQPDISDKAPANAAAVKTTFNAQTRSDIARTKAPSIGVTKV
jgi:hypothetical protein